MSPAKGWGIWGRYTAELDAASSYSYIKHPLICCKLGPRWLKKCTVVEGVMTWKLVGGTYLCAALSKILPAAEQNLWSRWSTTGLLSLVESFLSSWWPISEERMRRNKVRRRRMFLNIMCLVLILSPKGCRICFEGLNKCKCTISSKGDGNMSP